MVREIFNLYTDSSLMKEFNKWRVKHGIPEEVFITLASKKTSVTNSEKPFWFNFYSVLSIDLLKKAISDHHENIIFTEALPSSSQQWFQKDNKHYTTEFMTLGANF